MKYFSATVFSGIAFVLALFFSGSLPISLANVSPETGVNDVRNESVSVKQGVSQDGLLVISPVVNPPNVPARIKIPNHPRTLRAFIAPNRGGVLTLYVETAKPHQYFSLKGKFALVPDQGVLAWTGDSTISFYGNSNQGILKRYDVDVHASTLSEMAIDGGSPLSQDKAMQIVP